jgi:hypothetical protein
MTRDKLTQRIADRIFAHLPSATSKEAQASHRLADRAAAGVVEALAQIAHVKSQTTERFGRQ